MRLPSVSRVAIGAARWINKFPFRFQRGLRRETHAHNPLWTEPHSKRRLRPRAESAPQRRFVARGVVVLTGSDSARAAEFEKAAGHGVEVGRIVVHRTEHTVRPGGVRAGYTARARTGAVVKKAVAKNSSAQAHDGGEHAKIENTHCCNNRPAGGRTLSRGTPRMAWKPVSRKRRSQAGVELREPAGVLVVGGFK